MFLAQFLSGVGFSFVFPFFPFYFRELGLRNDDEVFLWMGYTSLVFGITMAVSAPLWGIIADRYGRKIMVIRSMFAGAVVLGLMGLATNPWHILILRFLQGMTTGTVTASVTLVSSVTPAARLGFSLGIVQTGLLVGNAVGPFIGGLMADQFGYRVPCGLAFIILFVGALLVIFGAKENFIKPAGHRENGLHTVRGILNTEGFLTVLVVYFMIYTLGGMIIPVLPIFIEQLAHDVSRVNTISGTFVAVAGLLSGFSAAYFGKIGDRFGHSRVLLISLILTGAVSIPQAFANNLWELFIERCLFGLAGGGIIPAVNVIVSHIIPKDRVGSAYGLTSSVTCLGIGAGPAIGGSVAAAIGLRWPFAFMGVFAFMLAFLVNRMLGGRAQTYPKNIGGEDAIPPLSQAAS
jgi:DHA1 family multidrug resistance protein-like MFS transporter